MSKTNVFMSKHLLSAFRTPAKVTCGDWKIDATDANEHTLEVTGVTLHPKYDGFGNDIAVVRVKGTMPCSKGKIWPACLPNKEVNKFHVHQCQAQIEI